MKCRNKLQITKRLLVDIFDNILHSGWTSIINCKTMYWHSSIAAVSIITK